jgi:hypothetical protein
MEEQPIKPIKLRPCPSCGQMYEVKSPWKALWRWPSLNEWITLFMIVMMIFGAWAYKHDVGVCQNYVKNIDAVCAQRGIIAVQSNYSMWPPISSVNITQSNLNVSDSNGTTR